jgi:hypothetical protein
VCGNEPQFSIEAVGRSFLKIVFSAVFAFDFYNLK